MPRMRLRAALKRVAGEVLDAKTLATGLLLSPDLPEPRRDVVVCLDRRLRRLHEDLGALTDRLADPDGATQMRLPYSFGVSTAARPRSGRPEQTAGGVDKHCE